MDKLSRRDVLARVAAVGGGAVAFAATGVASADTPAAPAPSTPDAPPIVWVNVGPLPDMKVNDMQRVSIPNSPTNEVIYVKRASDKDYAAFSARCTHRGCVLGYDSTTTVFTCPCHGGQFDIMGNVTKGPPQRPLVPLAVKFDDKKNLWVQTPPPPPARHSSQLPPPPTAAPAPAQ